MEQCNDEQLIPLWIIEEEELHSEEVEEAEDIEVEVQEVEADLSSRAQVDLLEEEKKELLEKQQSLEAKARQVERKNMRLEKQQRSLEKRLKQAEERRSQLEQLFLELKSKKNAALRRSKVGVASRRKKRRSKSVTP